MTRRTKQERSAKAYRDGVWAEKIARLWLGLKGYHLIEQRYKTSSGEVDLIMGRGAVVAFIEVKKRPSYARAAEIISTHQQARIQKAVGHFLAHQPAYAKHAIRFDVVLIVPWRWPVHFARAWG